jgi:hypothetical protein
MRSVINCGCALSDLENALRGITLRSQLRSGRSPASPQTRDLPGIRHGKTGAKGFFEALGSDHANPQLTITEYVASGEVTSKKFDSPIAHYWKFRDGKIVRYIGFANTAAAVEALQPSSSTASR